MRCCSVAIWLAVTLAGAALQPVRAQQASTPAAATQLPLFVIEVKVGAKWDASKPPQEQAFFREHSANLRRLRDAGHIVLGARYSDKGLVIVAASTLADAKAMMDGDPSIAAGTFAIEVHPFNVFYPGSVPSRSAR